MTVTVPYDLGTGFLKDKYENKVYTIFMAEAFH